MMYNRKPGGPGTWPKRLMAVFGSVMLVLSLIPTQGLAEALTELGAEETDDIEVVNDASEDIVAIAQEEGVQIVDDDQSTSEDVVDAIAQEDEDEVIAIAHDDSNPLNLQMTNVSYKTSNGSESPYDAENQEITWKVQFVVPSRGLSSATITDIMPSATIDGKTYRDTLANDYAIDVSGIPINKIPDPNPEEQTPEEKEGEQPEEPYISTEVYRFWRTDEGFALEFNDGLPANDSEYVLTILIRSNIDQEWFSASKQVEDHTNKVVLTAAGYSSEYEATASVRVNPANCAHTSGKYVVANTEVHRWECNYCPYYREEKHDFTTSGSIKCKQCNVEGVKVTFNNGGGSGSMNNEFYAKGFDYPLPTPTRFAGPNGLAFDCWEVNYTGLSVPLKMYAGDVIKLTSDVTLKAQWASGIDYIDGGEPKTQVGYTTIGLSTKTLNKGWYVVKGNTNLKGNGVIEVNDDAKLILCDGSKLTVDGIKVNGRKTLTVYGQSNDSATVSFAGNNGIVNYGKLIINAGEFTDAKEACIFTEGECVLNGGTIRNNAIGVKYGSSANAIVSVRGKPKIEDNTNKNDVLLRAGKYIDVTGPLAAGASIGVKLEVPTSRKITRNYSTMNGNADPTAYFKSSTSPFKLSNVLDDGEVEIYDPRAYYLDENGDTPRVKDYIPVSKLLDESGVPSRALMTGWYVVDQDTTVSSRLNINGDVKLVLFDNATLTCNNGIGMKRGSLTIYAQQTGADESVGKIVASASSEGYAGIGGDTGDNTKLEIRGGVITAKGARFGAGIGGGGNGGDGGTIDVYDGKVVAIGGEEAAGIGGGHAVTVKKDDEETVNEGKSGTITIHGGEVESTGGLYGAGIGGGKGSAVDSIMVLGGKVTATGGMDGAGIGGGKNRSAEGTIALGGGVVTAQGGSYAAGIGGGELGRGGKVFIAGDVVVDAKGGTESAAIGGGDNAAGGDVTIRGNECTVRVEAGESLSDEGNAEGIGRGDLESQASGALTLAPGAMLWVKANDSVDHVLMDERVEALRSPVAELSPCEHPDSGAQFTYNVKGHNVVCEYCDSSNSEPIPHEFNEDGICQCGAHSGKIDFYPGEGGKGDIITDTYVIDRDYYLPECDFTPVVKQSKFAYWIIDGQRYDTNDSIVFDTNQVVTATAVWTTPITYVDAKGTEITTGDYHPLRAEDTEWANGFYVAMEDELTIPEQVLVTGDDVSLILRDDATLKVEQEFIVEDGATLNIYRQGKGTGKLAGQAVAGDIVNDGNGFLWNMGVLNLYGGNITGYACVDNDGTFVMRGGTIEPVDWGLSNQGLTNIYDGTINGGEWGITISSGRVVMQGGTIQGANEGVEILYGRLELSGGTIKKSKTYGVRAYAGSGFVLADSPTFNENGTCDVMLEDGMYIRMQKISSGISPIKVALQSGKGVITKDYERNNPDLDPTKVFTAIDPCYVKNELLDGEVEIVGSVNYYDENQEKQDCDNFTAFTKNTPTVENELAYVDAGWYLVSGEVDLVNTMVVQDEVNLILSDGAKLNANRGVRVEENAKLVIWGGKEGSGTLVAKGAGVCAGIGAQNMGTVPGTVVVHWGTVQAEGARNTPGIQCSDGSTVEILGGTVMATAGKGMSSAIGCAKDGTLGNIVLGDKLSVAANNDLVASADRLGTCSSVAQVTIAPCEHKNATYETTPTTHKFICANCLLQGEVEAHTLNNNDECTVCGYCDTVTITFVAGNQGTGSMEAIQVPRDKEVELPACTFDHPDGIAFAGWQIGDKIVDAERPYTFTEDTTLTATWAQGFKVFATTRTESSSATVGDVSMTPTKDSYTSGSKVTITAPALNGYEFIGWYEALSTDVEGRVTSYGSEVLCSILAYELSVNSDISVCAVYKPMGTAYVSIVGNGKFRVNDKGSATSNYTKKHTIGSEIKIAVADGYRVLQWEDAQSKKILGTGVEYKSVVGSDLSIKLVCYEDDSEDSSYVQWVSDFGQVFASMNMDNSLEASDIAEDIPRGPSKFGYVFDKWVFEGSEVEATPDAILSRVGSESVITLVPSYTKIDSKYTLNVHYVDENNNTISATDTRIGEMGEIYSPTAKNVNGYTFAYWKNDDGTIIGYSKEYIMQYTRDKDLYVCYVKSGQSVPNPEPVVYLRRLVPVDVTGETTLFKVSATRCVPENDWEVIEWGILGASGFNNPTPQSFVAGASGIRLAKSADLKNLNSIKDLHATATNLDDVWTFRGYMKLKDLRSNNIKYFYSDIRSMSYNQMMESLNE